MHTRNIFYLLIGLLLIALPASAQDSPTWSIYLYDNISYELIRVDAIGSLDVFSMGVGENSYVGLNQMAISNDGTLLAYCKETRNNPNDYVGDKTVIVRDIAGETDLLTLDYGAIPGCAVTAFSEDSSQIAVSLVNELLYVAGVEDTPLPAWQLQLIDVATGTIIDELNADEGLIPPFTDFGEGVPLLAEVRRFEANQLSFVALPFIGIDGPPQVPAYVWNLNNNTVEALPNLGRMNADYLAETGEIAYTSYDEAYEAAAAVGPLPSSNTLNIGLRDGSSQVIYRNQEWVIIGADFINDGQSLAISLLVGWNPDKPEETSTMRYEILNRDGSIEELDMRFDGYNEIVAVEDGAVLTWTINPTAEGYQASYVAYWDGTSLNTIAEFTPDYTQGFSPPMLVWSTPMNITAMNFASFGTIE